MSYPQVKFQQDWVLNGASSQMVVWANSFGKYLTEKDDTDPLTTSQLRRFFGELRRIEADFENAQSDIPMLIPKLAYAVGRAFDARRRRAKTKVLEFYEAVDKGLGYIRLDAEECKSDFENFVKVIEAIVAFHKYHGGKDS